MRLTILFLLLAVPVAAQQRPIAATTVQTTDTGANSISVGCPVGSTTCIGGINAGGLTVTRGVNGVHVITIRNTTAGAAAQTAISIGNDLSAGVGQLGSYSSTTTPVGSLFLSDSVFLYSTGVGGIQIGSNNVAGSLKFFTGGLLQRWGINAAGDYTFGVNAHIADSSGTPTIASGFGTSPAIKGTDYAFNVTLGSGSSSSGIVNFGHNTFTTAPVCATGGNLALGTVGVLASTTAVTLVYAAATAGDVYVICRGY